MGVRVVSEVVEGEISLGSGWWLELPQAYELLYDGGSPVLQREVTQVNGSRAVIRNANMLVRTG